VRTPEELRNAISKWSIGGAVKWEVAERGEVNRNFILTAGEGKFVLRQVLSHSHYQRPSDLEFELGYLNYLKKAGFPYHVPVAIPSRTGKLFAKVRGRYFWLYKFIEGKAIGRLNESHLTQLTKMMGTYHRLLERSGLDNGKSSVDVYSRASTLKEMEGYRLEVLRKHRMSGQEDVTFMEESARLIALLRNLDETPYSNLKRYPIHRDIIPENLIWQGTKLVGLIDFEHVSGTNEPTVKDIAVAIQFICRDNKLKHQLDLKLASRFLQSYRKWHSVSAREVRLIPNLVVSGFIEDFAWTYWMLRNDPQRARPDALKLYSRAALWSYESREEITRALLN
jgi:Ser/Thr protein kinase RdoA (MazF antagonist)